MSNSERDQEVRRTLVSLADSSAIHDKKHRLKFAGAAFAVFAIAGGVTGGLSAAAVESDSLSAADVSFVVSMAQPNSQAVGTPQFVDATESGSLQMGSMPAEATALALVIRCLSADTFTEFLDGEPLGTLTCEESSGGSGTSVPVSGSGEHTITISSSPTGRFQAWGVWVKEPPAVEMSAQQLVEVSDAVVTRNEYLAAFNRLVGCMGAQGFDIAISDPDAVIYYYPMAEQPGIEAAYDTCYRSQFREVDTIWQDENADVSETADLLRSCLTKHGIEPAEHLEDMVAQMNAANLNAGTGCH